MYNVDKINYCYKFLLVVLINMCGKRKCLCYINLYIGICYVYGVCLFGFFSGKFNFIFNMNDK